ncbi:hypothetical protein DXG01_009987 [Tephrocybe rancida]|nr:hypothetical protein DXG01_009987 [Tephrocybe rancida]
MNKAIVINTGAFKHITMPQPSTPTARRLRAAGFDLGNNDGEFVEINNSLQDDRGLVYSDSSSDSLPLKASKPTPLSRSVGTRQQDPMRERLQEHRFHLQYERDTCEVTGKTCKSATLVQMAHLLPFATPPDTLFGVEWCLGYPYSSTLNIDTRMNGMFLWVDIHQMFDAMIISLLLDEHQIKLIGALFKENQECDTLSKRKHIPHTLDSQMPPDGWTYTVVSMVQDNPSWELIHRHAVCRTEKKKLRPTSKVTAYPAPYNFQIKSPASPAFILASFHYRMNIEKKRRAKAKRTKGKKGKNSDIVHPPANVMDRLPEFWGEDVTNKAKAMLSLAQKMFATSRPRDFKDPPSGHNTRGSKVEEADYTTDQKPHDYRAWPNTPKPSGTKRPGTPIRSEAYNLEGAPTVLFKLDVRSPDDTSDDSADEYNADDDNSDGA